MTKSGVSINWGGLKESVEKAAVEVGNAQGLMAKIGKAMKGHATRRFQAGAGPEGEKWKPLAGPRKNRKGRDGKPEKNPKPILDTARLRDSISFSATPSEVHVGSNVEYARIHQLGGQAGRGRKVTIPARPYLGLSEEDKEEIADLVKQHLAGAFQG